MRHPRARSLTCYPTRPAARRRAGAATWLCMGSVLALVLALAPGRPRAEPLAADLPDPTRPPAAALLTPADNPRLGRLLAGPRPDTVASDSLPELQSVQMPSRGRPTAMINGQLLRVGDLFDGMQVMVIDHMGITLRTPKGPRRIALLMANGKQPAGSIVINQRVGYAPEPADAAGASPNANQAAIGFIQGPQPNAAAAAVAAPRRASATVQTPTANPGAASTLSKTPNAPTAVVARNRP